MTNWTKNATCFCIVALLVLSQGCKPPPEPIPPTPAQGQRRPQPVQTTPAQPPARVQIPTSQWIGQWEGKDSKGDTYIIKFSNTSWESYIEKNGITIPYFKGTYTHSTDRVDLKIMEELDATSMKWKTATTIFPSIVGRLYGSVLNVAVFTEADLRKK
ncbi:MAG: hypothetical protein FWG02_07080 [Holophagaceae bacterium]|nr:hypothetical protein [Holophagaceae bacterium]